MRRGAQDERQAGVSLRAPLPAAARSLPPQLTVTILTCCSPLWLVCTDAIAAAAPATRRPLVRARVSQKGDWWCRGRRRRGAERRETCLLLLCCSVSRYCLRAARVGSGAQGLGRLRGGGLLCWRVGAAPATSGRRPRAASLRRCWPVPRAAGLLPAASAATGCRPRCREARCRRARRARQPSSRQLASARPGVQGGATRRLSLWVGRSQFTARRRQHMTHVCGRVACSAAPGRWLAGQASLRAALGSRQGGVGPAAQSLQQRRLAASDAAADTAHFARGERGAAVRMCMA